MPSNETQFKEGKSGNPGGRPKGSKNKITLLKQKLELELREASQDRMPEVLKRAFDLALEGDRTMIKLLLELHMSKGIAEEKSSGQEKVDIHITTNAPAAPKKAPVEAIIEDKENAGEG